MNHTVGIMGNINIQNEANALVQPLILDGTRLLEYHNVNFTPVVTTVAHPNTPVDAEVENNELKYSKEMSANLEKTNENSLTFQPKESASTSSSYRTEAQTSTTYTQSETYSYQNFE